MSFSPPPPVTDKAAAAAVSQPRKQQPDRRGAASELFANPETHGAVLLQVALRFLDYEELQSYHPTTIRMELARELRLREVPDDNLSKLMAATTILTTDLFYHSLPHFIDICNVLSDSQPIPGWWDPADPYEMSWAVASTTLIDPVQARDMEFTDEIRLYMGIALQEFGFNKPPRFLSMAIMPPPMSLQDISQDSEILGAALEMSDVNVAELSADVSKNLAEVAEQLRPFLFAEDEDR